MRSIISDPPPPYEAEEEVNTLSEPPLKRFLKWPYYRPPPGWIVHPAWDLRRYPPNWRVFVPSNDLSAYPHPSPSDLRSELYSPLLSPDTSNAPLLQQAGHPGFSTPASSPACPFLSHHSSLSTLPPVQALRHCRPSPFFAFIPPEGPSDPQFAAYRQAQASSPTSHKHPVVHPVVAYYTGQTTPSIFLDLSERPNLNALAGSAIVPLYREEFDTFVTHPPIRGLRLALASHPKFVYTLKVPPPEGLTLRHLVNALVTWAARRLRPDEWDMLDKRQRDLVRAAYQRRTGGAQSVVRIAQDETPYLVRDLLGENVMFLGVERQRGMKENGDDTYFLYTTTHSRCRAWR